MHHPEIIFYSKIEIAEIQLNRSIKILIENNDIISAITLAGAADDILWKSLEQSGQKSQLTEVADSMREMLKTVDLDFKASDFFNEIHIFRTELKHLRSEFSGDKVPIPAEAALEIINRCCENYRRLLGKYPSEMHLLENMARNS